MSATFLISAGADVRTVSGKLGHSRTGTTMDIYSHLVTASEKKTAETMEAFLSETKNSTPKPDANKGTNVQKNDDEAQN